MRADCWEKKRKEKSHTADVRSPLKNIILLWNFVEPFLVQVQGKKVFPLTNDPWNDEKNCFLADTALVLEMHFQVLSCNDFYNMVLDYLKLLEEISSSTKCKNLPMRSNQLLQHKLEINCKSNLVNENM
jgi:hypothetical protein